jgi:hypothetical protein
LVVGHLGQAGQHVREIGMRINAPAPAAFDDRVNDGPAFSGLSLAQEEPVFPKAVGRLEFSTMGCLMTIVISIRAQAFNVKRPIS